MFRATVFPVISESGDIIGHVDDDQLTRLHDEAEAAGDYAAAAWCDLALSYAEDGDEDGNDLLDPVTGQPTTRSEARRVCLAMIDDAEARRDDDDDDDDETKLRAMWLRVSAMR